VFVGGVLRLWHLSTWLDLLHLISSVCSALQYISYYFQAKLWVLFRFSNICPRKPQFQTEACFYFILWIMTLFMQGSTDLTEIFRIFRPGVLRKIVENDFFTLIAVFAGAQSWAFWEKGHFF
jgi:hypothetical protein